MRIAERDAADRDIRRRGRENTHRVERRGWQEWWEVAVCCRRGCAPCRQQRRGIPGAWRVAVEGGECGRAVEAAAEAEVGVEVEAEEGVIAVMGAVEAVGKRRS